MSQDGDIAVRVTQFPHALASRLAATLRPRSGAS